MNVEKVNVKCSGNSSFDHVVPASHTPECGGDVSLKQIKGYKGK